MNNGIKNGNSHIFFERQNLYLSSYKNRKLKVNCDELELTKENRRRFLQRLFCLKEFFQKFVFSQYVVY